MLIVDDVALCPFKGILFVLRRIHAAVEEAMYDRPSILQEIQRLYMEFETGRISEEEFGAREKDLLARLEAASREE